MTPVDRPTVPKAETTSKSTSSTGYFVIWLMAIVESATVVAPQATTLSATRCTSEGMRRPNACTDGRPFASLITARASTASVVTLMPPAVDAEPPPTNMSIEAASIEDPLRSPMFTTLKPPERVMAERKNAWNVVSPASIDPKVFGLSNSSRRKTAAPTTNSTIVVSTVSLACSDQRRTCQRCRASV